MDEDSASVQDVPEFIRSTINQLITLKSNVSSIDNFHNDMKQLDVHANVNIIDFGNKIKNFLNSYKITVTDINSEFLRKFEDFINESDTKNGRIRKFNIETEPTISELTDRLKDRKNIENSDSDADDSTKIRSKCRKKRKKSAELISGNDISDSESVKTTKNKKKKCIVSNEFNSDTEQNSKKSIISEKVENCVLESDSDKSKDIISNSESESSKKNTEKRKIKKTRKTAENICSSTDSRDSDTEKGESTRRIKERKGGTDTKLDDFDDETNIGSESSEKKSKKNMKPRNKKSEAVDLDSDSENIRNIDKNRKSRIESDSDVELSALKSRNTSTSDHKTDEYTKKDKSKTKTSDKNKKDDLETHSDSSTRDKSDKSDNEISNCKVNSRSDDYDSYIEDSKKNKREYKNTVEKSKIDDKSSKESTKSKEIDILEKSDNEITNKIVDTDCESGDSQKSESNSKKSKNKTRKDKSRSDSDCDRKEKSDKNNLEISNNEVNKTFTFSDDSDSYTEDPKEIIEKSKKSVAKSKSKDIEKKIIEDSEAEKSNEIDKPQSSNDKIVDKDNDTVKHDNDDDEKNKDISKEVEGTKSANQEVTSKELSEDQTDKNEKSLSKNAEATICVDNENSGNNVENVKIEKEDEKDEKPKIGFIKCISIDKLLDPALKQRKVPQKVPESVIILSSSDSDIEIKTNSSNKSDEKADKKIKEDDKSKKGHTQANDNSKTTKKDKSKKKKDSSDDDSDYEKSISRTSRKNNKKNLREKSKSKKYGADDSSDKESSKKNSKEIIIDSDDSDSEKNIDKTSKKENRREKTKTKKHESDDSSDESKKKNKKVVTSESDSSDSLEDKRRRLRFYQKKKRLSQISKKKFEQFRTLRQRRPVKNIVAEIKISSSDSESSDSLSKVQEYTKKGNKSKKVETPFVIDPNYDYTKDIKFKVECFVSLPKIAVEKLKDYYLQQREDAEIKRLTNMKSLKRTRQQNSASSSENGTRTTKRTKTLRKKKNNDTEEQSDSDQVDNASLTPEVSIDVFDSKQKDTGPIIPEDFLDSGAGSKIPKDCSDSDEEEKKKSKKGDKDQGCKKSEDSSDSDEEEKKKLKEGDKDKGSKKSVDSSDSDQEEKKKSKKGEKDKEAKKSDEKSDKSEENGKDSEKHEEDKGKSKWRNDPLLRGKLSASDSEDELIRFRKKKEKIEQEIKSGNDEELNVTKTSKTKKQIKRIARRLNSDVSSSEDEAIEIVESENEKEKSSEKSSSDSEDDKKKEKPVRRRIKKINDSEDSSDTEAKEKKDKKDKEEEDEQNTRKKIRNVWSKDSLAQSTKEAAKEEEERRKRIAERQKKYNAAYGIKLDENAKVDKVVLDINEETGEELLSVHPDLVKQLKPHQAEGVQFMWTACYESLDRAQNTEGSGCILAHCMGLGKTFQVITLIHTLLSHSDKTKVKTVLVVCPLSTVLNWVNEFKKWLDDLNDEEVNVFDLVQYKQNYERLYHMQDWMKYGGVMIMGYDMFRNFCNSKGKRMPKKLVNGFNRVLLDPGPDLVICDEGHLLKNEKTGISIAMNRIKTMRRIVLTGTPLQNNLKEYFCMVHFVKPSLLGTYKEYLNRFVNPITNGQYTDSTPHDIQIMRRRAHVLHKMLSGVVDRRDYNVLAPYLPMKFEYILFVSLSKVQIELYREYLTKFSRNTSVKGTSYLFQDFQELQRICIHPRVLLDKNKQDKMRRDNDEEEDDGSEGSLKDFINDDDTDKSTTSNDSSSGSDSESEKQKKTTAKTRRTRANPGAVEEEQPEIIEVANEWWSKFCQGDVLDSICHSSKLTLLFDILHQCEAIGDKVLVFSQSLYSLNLIEYFLSKIDEATQSGDTEALAKVGGFTGSWALGLDYFRMDGSTSCDNRSAWCNSFNNEANTRARLFLISTRAGGLGINLVAANRVIIFDVSWNPSHDIQSIYRIYRFGQTKPCYIYRFVTLGTMENKIYERQVTKQAISKRVIDEQQIDRHYNQNDLAELYAFNPVPEEPRPIPIVPKDILFADLLQSHADQIFKYHEHNSLLEDKADEGLNEEERRAAWEEFENEKKAPKFNLMQTMVRNGMYETLRLLVQEDNSGWTPAQINNILPVIVQRISEQVARGDFTMYRRVEERHEVRVLEQRRLQMVYQQYLQQMRNASGGAPMTPADINKLTQMISSYNQNFNQQARPNMPGTSLAGTFNQGEPPQMGAAPPPRIVGGVVELND